MLIYRLEHRSSRLGPFQHKTSRQKHPSQDALKYIYSDARKFMLDITDDPWVKELLTRHPKAVFGWSDEKQFNTMVKDQQALHDLGFRKVVYDQEPLYISLCGQVLFVRSHLAASLSA